jgi:glutamate carboxypeptidase
LIHHFNEPMMNQPMNQFLPHLSWIDSQHQRMVSLVTRWANINSGTYHLAGLHHLSQGIQLAFASLNPEITEHLRLAPYKKIDSRGQPIEAPLGDALRFRKRPDALLRVFLCIHMDTVYPEDSLFQQTKLLEPNKLNGPGVTDAKGGIVIMLIALECLERFVGSGSPDIRPGNIGWEVLLNPDEEIGSPGSRPFLMEAAKRNHLGLLFEPALPNGALASERKGSGNFTVVVRGRSAHAGRNPQDGRSAIVALAQIILALSDLPRQLPGLTVNVGQVEGGGALNMVPDLAIGRFNVRLPVHGVPSATVHEHLERLVGSFNREGIVVELHGGITSPPKVVDERAATLMEEVRTCGAELGLNLNFRPTGGTCDGNRLAAAGLPCVDSLGARGDQIHSPDEFLYLDSLAERAKLTALLLMKLAAGEIHQ